MDFRCSCIHGAIQVSEILYAFSCHGGGFGIKGYIVSEFNEKLNFAHELLPINVLRIFNIIIEGLCFCSFSLLYSIFTNWGQAWDANNITLDEEYHYNDLKAEQVNPDWIIYD